LWVSAVNKKLKIKSDIFLSGSVGGIRISVAQPFSVAPHEAVVHRRFKAALAGGVERYLLDDMARSVSAK